MMHAQMRRLSNLERGNDIKYRGKITCPDNCHHLVRDFFAIVNREKAFLKEVSDRSGINRSTMDGWRRDGNPNIVNFEAALNALGYELHIRRRR